MRSRDIPKSVSRFRKLAQTSRFGLFWLGLALLPVCKTKRVEQAREAVHAFPFPSVRAIFVTNNGSDTLSVIDRTAPVESQSAMHSASVDLEADLHEAPHHVVVNTKAHTVFVALGFPPDEQPDQKAQHRAHGKSGIKGKLVKLDLETLAIKEHVAVDENPGDIAQTHTGERILVTHFDMAKALRAAAKSPNPSEMYASLQLWKSEPLTLLQSRTLCVAPHGMAISKDDRFALVACYGSDEVAWVDLETFAVSKIPVGPSPGILGSPRYGPYAVTLSNDGAHAAVTSLESGDLRWLDMKTRTFQNTASFGARAFMPAFLEGDDVLVPLQAPDGFARVHAFETSAFKRSNADPRCLRPHAVVRSKNDQVYAVCEGDHKARGTVVELDPASLDILRVWTVGVYPDGIALGEPD
jgi:DNA-binding beta-propeller fold protein YncE